jgi:hypothetical protein
MSALVVAAKSNPTRDELEAPRDLHDWISSNFSPQATVDVVDLTRQIRELHRSKDEPMARF